MQDTNHANATPLENKITGLYGPLLSQDQLAQLLGRSAGGLRYSLCNPSDSKTWALKACARRIGRRVYYPASDVAAIIAAVDL
jgi:hypothetical protein